jgi:quinol monooxygenase YgiN
MLISGRALVLAPSLQMAGTVMAPYHRKVMAPYHPNSHGAIPRPSDKAILAVPLGPSPTMTTISLSPKLVTLINVFTVEPANQQQLLELLARATETSVRHAPGFISSSLHRGLDGTKVTMYAQWRSVEDYQAMRANPAPLPYLQQALAIARFEPGMYEVVEIFSGTSSEP